MPGKTLIRKEQSDLSVFPVFYGIQGLTTGPSLHTLEKRIRPAGNRPAERVHL